MTKPATSTKITYQVILVEVVYTNQNINELFSDLFDIANSRNLLQKKIGPNLAKKSKMRITHLKSSEALKICEKVMIIGIVDYHGDKNEWLIA